MKLYCACPIQGKYSVGFMGPCQQFHVIGDIRQFETFDEANDVALACSEGRYDCEKGEFLNMR